MIRARWLRTLIISMMSFLSVFSAHVFAVEANASHIVLLDVSGSMEREGSVRYARYSSGQVSEIVRQLATSISSADHDSSIYVQPFSSSHESFPLRGPIAASKIEDAVPATAQARETELDAGLRLGMRNRPNSYLFILTDNKNDFAGSKSDREFYDLLAKSPSIHTVYFIPLAQPHSKESLVLYAVACGLAQRSVLRQIASDFAIAMHTDSVQFRGFYDDKQQESLNFSQRVMRTDENGDESAAIMEGDAIVLPYEEGRSVDGALRFRIHSNLKHWRIKNGELRKLDVRLTVPPQYANSGESKLPLNVSGGRKMNIAPRGDSAEVYTLPLGSISDQGVSLVRKNLFETSLPDVVATIHISTVIRVSEILSNSGIQPEFTDALKGKIEAVHDLPKIMNLMTFQPDTTSTAAYMERVIPVNREVLFRVAPNPLKNLAARSIEFGLPALLLASLAAIAFLTPSKVYVVTEPGERTRPLKFTFMNRGVALTWNSRRVAMIQRSGGGFVIRPEAGFSVEPSVVQGNPARFEIRKLISGERGLYQVRPGAAQVKTSFQRRKL